MIAVVADGRKHPARAATTLQVLLQKSPELSNAYLLNAFAND